MSCTNEEENVYFSLAPSRVAEGAVGVRVVQARNACSRVCSCVCHTQIKKATPKLVNRFIGQLFIGYSGLPYLNQKCDVATCENAQSSHISAEYWFPLGFFWSQIVRFQVDYKGAFGPQFQLSTLRQVPDSAQCVNFAINGNVEGLKHLFQKGLASPRDVSSTRGYSLLRWAVYAKQWEACRFLVHEGADVDYRPIATHDNSPRNKAFDEILQGGHTTREAIDALTLITQGGDFIDDQNFTLLHKIVLCLSPLKLEDEISSHLEDVNAVDAMNRTPLTWAAAQGDSHAIKVLLSYGADPNILDVEYTGPVAYSALRNHAYCTLLLLRSGAQTDPKITAGIKIGSPLNCASRNATDSSVMKNLIDFGADVEACGVDGRTPLLHVARTGNADFALLLLEAGACITAMCTAGQTPLTTAIINHSHNVLQLLVDWWYEYEYEYSAGPRLSGPDLLETVAKYADTRTIDILMSSTDHFKLQYQQRCNVKRYIRYINERADSSEKLLTAFIDFLKVINATADPKEATTDVLLEAGYASFAPESSLDAPGVYSEKDHERTDDGETGLVFEDAAEQKLIEIECGSL